MDIEEILKITQESMDDALNCAGAKLDALRAENQRLREALEMIRIVPRNFKSGSTYVERLRRMVAIAEQALKG